MTQAFNLSQLANNLNTSGQLDATDGLTGVVPTGNLPTIPVSKGGTNLTATPSNGQIPIGNGSGYSLATLTAGTNISISNSSGAVTINATAGAPTTAQVLSATAGLTAGAVGSYAFLSYSNGGGQTFGSTRAGSSLRPCGFYYNADVLQVYPINSGSTVAGTWRCLGHQASSSSFTDQSVIWVRIS
jgi:hypothetical protein